MESIEVDNSPLIIDDLDSLLGATIADDGTVHRVVIAGTNSFAVIKIRLQRENLDYYDYIFGAAIGSNPANAYYTGGSASLAW